MFFFLTFLALMFCSNVCFRFMLLLYHPFYVLQVRELQGQLRSYRTLLKHLQTCAKVAKNKAAKIETGMASDADPTNVPPTSADMESSGPI